MYKFHTNNELVDYLAVKYNLDHSVITSMKKVNEKNIVIVNYMTAHRLY